MKIIAIYNNKGGCGKTTTCINLAYNIAEVRNKKVLVIDSDGQGNLTNFFKNELKHSKTTDMILSGECAVLEAVEATRYNNIDLIPASDELKQTELILTSKGDDEVIKILKKIREDLESKYDFVFVDMSPFNNNVTDYLLMLVHYVLIPCDVGRFSLEGISTVYSAVNALGADVLGLVITKYNKRNKVHNKIVQLINSKVRGTVFKPIIPQSNIIDNSISYGVAAYEYSHRWASADYLELADNVLKTIERK